MDDIDFGILIGWLKAMARVNDRANFGHSFELRMFPKTTEMDYDFKQNPFWKAHNIGYERITDARSYLTSVTNKWFYDYDDYLDQKPSFSLSDLDWQREWVDEFVDLLMQTLKPESVWKIEMLSTNSHYANDYDDIVFDAGDRYCQLHFSVSD